MNPKNPFKESLSWDHFSKVITAIRPSILVAMSPNLVLIAAVMGESFWFDLATLWLVTRVLCGTYDFAASW